ncbi:MAG: GerW family sporulation protein [Candidatus Woodwardiibium sp.]
MNNELPLKQIIDAALSRIGSVADVNTVVGEPLAVGDGVTIIPFSKVSVGFASGGVDFDGKNKKEGDDPHFAGGNGAGVSVVPLGFLVIDGTEVRLLDLKHPEACAPRPQDPVNKAIDAINGIVDRAPDLVVKIKDLFSKDRASDEPIEPVEPVETAAASGED